MAEFAAPGTEYTLEVTFRQGPTDSVSDGTQNLVPEGHDVAWFQTIFKATPAAAPASEGGIDGTGVLSLNMEHDGGKGCTISGDGFSYVFGGVSGQLDHIIVDGGVDLLKHPTAPELWRAPTDNDLGGAYHKRRGAWQHASRDRHVHRTESKKIHENVIMFTSYARLVRDRLYYC
jgi:hypothetical protein